MKLLNPVSIGTFYEVDNTTILPEQSLSPCTLELGPPVKIQTMFSIYQLMLNSEKVGYAFQTAFRYRVGPAFLVTYLESKAGLTPKESKLLLRVPGLLVFDFPGHGSLALSTQTSVDLSTIFESQ